MKKYIFSFATLIILLAVCSCNKEAFMDTSSDPTTRADEKPWDVDFSELDTTYFVSDKDVEAYIHFKKLVAESEKREFEVREVVPLGLNDEATLAYLINYNEGWEIIAADKRAPTVLASDAQGNLDIKEVPDNMMAWIYSLEDDVLFLRASLETDVKDETIRKKMNQSTNFWSAILADEDFIRSKTTLHTRVVTDPPILVLGHWELVGTQVTHTTLQQVSPLLETNFHQGYPYNNCCPLLQPDPSRSPAGCVAIAGAQMAYYLHYAIDRPQMAASEGYCYSNAIYYYSGSDSYVIIPNAYQSIYVGNYSSTIWDTMLSNPSDAAYLIADIGKSVQMEYGYSASSAYTDKLVTNYFNPQGVYCRYRAYVADSVIYSIKNEMPVILDASQINNGEVAGGHAFIADGYRKVQSQLENIYTWVQDGTPTIPVPIPQDSIQVAVVYPASDMLHMNWGWAASYNGNYSWYNSSGNWDVSSYHLNYNRHMIHQFQ